MSKIIRYNGTMDANNTIITTIDTTLISDSTSFTVDIFYGGCDMDNASLPNESTWLYRYILTYDNIGGITLRDTHNVLSFGFNPSASLTSSLSGTDIELSTNLSSVGDPAQSIIIYDCYLNYN
jgi:hypothetical protein